MDGWWVHPIDLQWPLWRKLGLSYLNRANWATKQRTTLGTLPVEHRNWGHLFFHWDVNGRVTAPPFLNDGKWQQRCQTAAAVLIRTADYFHPPGEISSRSSVGIPSRFLVSPDAPALPCMWAGGGTRSPAGPGSWANLAGAEYSGGGTPSCLLLREEAPGLPPQQGKGVGRAPCAQHLAFFQDKCQENTFCAALKLHFFDLLACLSLCTCCYVGF